jgi:hypothetical protein
MRPNEIPGTWRVVANGSPATLQLWLTGGALNGQIKFDALPTVEHLTSPSFSWDPAHNWGLLQFGRPQASQQYTGHVRKDDVRGTFTQGGSAFDWFGRHVPSPLAGLTSERPRVLPLDHRAGPPSAPTLLIIVEERLLGSLLASFTGGDSVLTRYFDDLQSEGWEVSAYRYDVRSHETGDRSHRHLPSEFLDLYRFVRTFYETAQGVIAGLVLVGDFPAAGVATLHDQQAGSNLEQHELDYFAVDAVLSDPHGYWEWLGVTPMLPPGSTRGMRLPWDESRHPNGALNLIDQWSAPGFVAHTERQWQVHHSERNPQKVAADPQFWVGRITASQSAWRTGQGGFEYSEAEEARLIVEYFNRNHQHRTVARQRRGYIFIDLEFAGGWQNERTRMAAAVPQANILVHADDDALPATQRGTIVNYLSSFTQEFLVCQYVMHSDFLNHYFDAQPGSTDLVPASFPQSFASPGSPFSVPVSVGQNGISARHHFALPNRSPHGRFYLLGGCDVGDILHRPRFLVDGERVSAATPLHRQHGAQNLAVTYLMRGNGLAVLAHNVTNPPGDYTPIYQAWQQGQCLGDGVLQLLRSENVAAQVAHPYRNIVFGDPTLKLSY